MTSRITALPANLAWPGFGAQTKAVEEPHVNIDKGARAQAQIDRAALLKQLHASVKPAELAGRTVWIPMAAISANWIGILCCIAAMAITPWYLQPLLLVLIAARQHALLILMHDASHFLICRSKTWNDLISDFFCCFPFGLTTRSYRANHISHHEHLNTGDDPDLVRTVGPDAHAEEWLFRMPHKRLCKFFVQDLCGGGFLYLFKTMAELRTRAKTSKQARPEYRFPAAVTTAYAAALAALLYFSGRPLLILYGWLVPMLIVLPVLLRLRALAEHFALPRENALNGTRTVTPPWWERILIAPHNVSMHVEHHLFPFVPWFKLPELHQRLMQVEAYRQTVHLNDGYLTGSNSLLMDVASVDDDPRLALHH